MIVTVFIALGAVISAGVGYFLAHLNYKEDINNLDYRNQKLGKDYNYVVEQLAAAQDENVKLATQMLEALKPEDANDFIMQFIKDNATHFAHQWQHISTGNYSDLGPRKFRDQLVSERCACCGSVRRYWKDGDGGKYMPSQAGMFLGKKAITDEFKQVVCIGKLPLEFMKKKNSDLTSELIEEKDRVNVEEALEELARRHG